MSTPINAVQILRRISDLIDTRGTVSAECIGDAVIGLRDSIRFAIEHDAPQPVVYPQPGYDQGAGLRPAATVKDSLTTRSGAVPAGYALVPVEPTREMIRAVYPLHENTLGPELREHWAAMLSAAPSPPQGETFVQRSNRLAAEHAQEQLMTRREWEAIAAAEAPRSGDAPVAYQLRCNGGRWSECGRETFERGRCDVAGHVCEVRALYAAPPADARDAEDARRYRWLRAADCPSAQVIIDLAHDHSILADSEALDQHIDRAMGGE